MLQYQAPDGTWRTYHRAEFTYKSNWGHHYLTRDPVWQTETFAWSSYLIDPRTARFGGLATVLASGVKTSEWTSLHPQMFWPDGAALLDDPETQHRLEFHPRAELVSSLQPRSGGR
jgi:hypothetical protein